MHGCGLLVWPQSGFQHEYLQRQSLHALVVFSAVGKVPSALLFKLAAAALNQESSNVAAWVVRFRASGPDKGGIAWLVGRRGCASCASIVDFLVRGMDGACWQFGVAAPRIVRRRDKSDLPQYLAGDDAIGVNIEGLALVEQGDRA